MSLGDFFAPVPDTGEYYRPAQLGNLINRHERSFPDLEAVSMALFGVEEDRNAPNNKGCSEAANAVRPWLYQLYQGNFNASAIADLGNIKQGATTHDTYIAVKTVVSELIKENIMPVIIGGGQDITFGQYLAYEPVEQKADLVAIDSKFGLDELEGMPGEQGAASYLNRIILHEPNWLFNYSNIGYQTYFVNQEGIKLMEKMYFDVHRLGELIENIGNAEPIIRSANLFSLDISAIRASDAPGNAQASPNGFYGEQACQLCRYAGMNDRLLSAGFYEFNPRYDRNGQTAHLLAQMIWYFTEGYFGCKKDHPFGTHNDFVKYRTFLEGGVHEVLFYKSNRTDRWWMQIPYPPAGDRSKNERFHIIPCSYQDYQQACNGEMPDRWWKTYQKLV